MFSLASLRQGARDRHGAAASRSSLVGALRGGALLPPLLHGVRSAHDSDDVHRADAAPPAVSNHATARF